MSIHALLVDDEPQARTTLRQLLAEYCPGMISIAGEAGTVEEACQLILATVPDVLFLDMELAGRNGFDILHAFPPERRNFMTVVVSGYEQYGVRAVNEGVEYYLLKPVDIDELRHVVAQLLRKIRHNPAETLNNLNAHRNTVSPQHLYLSDGHGKRRAVPVESLMYCTPEGNYCRLYFRDSAPAIFYISMKKLGAVLPESSFIRIHHSCIANLHFIQEYNTSGHILLLDGTKLLVSRRHRKELMHTLKRYSLIS